uniref:DUF2853 family protein n=1 Tax=Steinernema glaseri TaxID=37863 RepID=A0A1I7XYS9_9BILA
MSPDVFDVLRYSCNAHACDASILGVVTTSKCNAYGDVSKIDLDTTRGQRESSANPQNNAQIALLIRAYKRSIQGDA